MVLLFNLAILLIENTKIKEHAIKLIDNKQLLYRFIYALILERLEILKIYIKTYSKIRIIQPFNSLEDASIKLNKKPDDSFCLYMNYLNILLSKTGIPYF